MAALNQERFTPATEDTIEELRNAAKNVDTSKSTSFWLSVWKTWCEGKSIALEIEEHEPAELNRLLEKFYAEVKNKNGEDYEPDSLRVMIAAFDRQLKDKQYPLVNCKRPGILLVEAGLGGKSEITATGRSCYAPQKSKKFNKRRRRIAMEEEQVRKYNPRGISKHNVVVTYPAFWSPRSARTSRNESG